MKFFDVANNGISRKTFLIRGLAVKVPRVTYGYRHFLHGLLSNDSETNFSRAHDEPALRGFCPVLFSIPFGIMVVMPRVPTMSESDFATFDYIGFVNREQYIIPAEAKPDSFGYLNGHIVAVDYGEWNWIK